jgi:hypothetical protein
MASGLFWKAQVRQGKAWYGVFGLRKASGLACFCVAGLALAWRVRVGP